jgi:hypothetical protein
MFLSLSPSPKGPIASVVSDYRSPLYLVKGEVHLEKQKSETKILKERPMTHIITPHRITDQTQRDENFILRGVSEFASRPHLQRVSPELEVVEASAKNAATFVNNEVSE